MNEPLVVLGLIPGIIIHSMLVLSILLIVASMFLKIVPLISRYYIPIRISGFVLLIFMVFAEGSYLVNQTWLEKAKELEEKIKIAEQEAVKENTVIEEKVIEKTRVIKEKGDVIVQYVDRVVKGDTQVIEKNMTDQEKADFQKKIEELQKAQKDCPLVPQIILEMHNEAAKSPIKGDKK